MTIDGFIPAGTKIYLKNKQLINIEHIKFGDEVLSIKILDGDLTNPLDIYEKYINVKDKKEIDLEKIKFSSSFVTDIRLLGHKQEELIMINNSNVIDKDQPVIFKNDKNKFEINTCSNLLNNNLDMLFVSISNEENKEEFTFNDSVKNSKPTQNKFPCFSMILSNNNFYITESAILLGRNL